MHALILDYQINRRRPGRADVALLLAGLIITAASATAALSLFPRISSLQAELKLHQQSVSADITDSTDTAPDDTNLRAELKLANGVVGLLSLPWDTLFTDIEASQNAQVALLAVEPDPEKSTLTLTAEAKDFAAMLTYMRLLQTRTSLRDVYLKSHTIDTKSAEHPVRFVLVASWVLQP